MPCTYLTLPHTLVYSSHTSCTRAHDPTPCVCAHVMCECAEMCVGECEDGDEMTGDGGGGEELTQGA